MKRKLIAFSTTMALLLSVFSAATVGAHTVAIEAPALTASRADWFGVQSDGSGIGVVQRNASQQGEYVFNDATKDQRLITTTDPVTRELDLDWFSVTGDAKAAYFLAKVDNYSGIANNPGLELLITVDTNQQNNSGTTDLPLVQASGTYSTTKVANDAAWEFALRTKFPVGTSGNKTVAGTTFIYTTAGGAGGNGTACTSCASQLAGASVFQGNFVEIRVPWNLIDSRSPQVDAPPAPGKYLRLTASTLYNDHTKPTNDGYNSPVIDTLGTESTLADLQDGTLNTSVDVHFDATGEVYAPLQVTEFQPNPLGNDSPGSTNQSTDTEWVEVYNPNSFAIPLSDYKLGNAAKRGSGQGMFKFKTATIAANAVVVVAREKSRFLAGHPGYVGTVYDVSNDMTQYTAWSGGSFQLDNGPSAPATTFEEQVLLLDGKDGIVDMATYGNSATPYPGHTPISTASVPEGVSFERCPVNHDTNNSAVDFITHGTSGQQTPGVVCVGRPGIDMQINKTAPSNFQPGDPVQFTISYDNGGDTDELASTVTITDTLPNGLSFTPSAGNAIPEPTTISGNKLVWVVPAPVHGGVLSTIILTTTSDINLGANIPLINTAVIASPNEQAITKDNNTAQATTTTLGPADTSISSNLSGAVPPGAQFQFTINYQNTGQDDATDVTITDVLPTGVTILSVASSDATWDNATSGTVTWDAGAMPPDSSGTIVVTAQLASSAVNGAPLTNALSITVPLNDPTPTNNVETKNLTVGLRKLYLPLIIR